MVTYLISACGVGLLGPDKQGFAVERMTDADVNQLSDIRLLSSSCRTGGGLDLFPRWFSVLFWLLVLRLVLLRFNVLTPGA
jgi:hypothetical protein